MLVTPEVAQPARKTKAVDATSIDLIPEDGKLMRYR
jgi:hypothetical protein